jgi:hypothetical protein
MFRIDRITNQSNQVVARGGTGHLTGTRLVIHKYKNTKPLVTNKRYTIYTEESRTFTGTLKTLQPEVLEFPDVREE